MKELLVTKLFRINNLNFIDEVKILKIHLRFLSVWKDQYFNVQSYLSKFFN